MDGSTSQTVRASLLAVALLAVLTVAMLPLRSHLSVATPALVLVVPVVVGAATGGFTAGIVATVCGFLVYDIVFIPPYYTLSVGAAVNWTALVVYVVVMVLVARVVTQLRRARADAQRRAAEVRRLFDLSELLVREAPLATLLERIVTAVLQAFELRGAALLLPVGGSLGLAASAGEPLSEAELARLSSRAGSLVAFEPLVEGEGEIRVVALSASGQAIGLLALRGLSSWRVHDELLRAFANDLALALERGELREQALRARLLEEVDRLRRSLVGAVSHDLRTPLATIKVSTSTLLDPEARLAPEELRELVRLIDLQADRLDRLVANLLDMTRIQSGSLELRRQPLEFEELLDEAEAVLGAAADPGRLKRELRADLPLVDVDGILVRQVLANLIDNAIRYGPEGTPVTVSAERRGDGRIVVAVSDRGPGVSLEQEEGIFEMVNRRRAGGGGGLGLAIARAFVEAHGERLWVDNLPGGGARFSFSLPVAERGR